MMLKTKIKVLKNFKVRIRPDKVFSYLKFKKNLTKLDKNSEQYILSQIQEFYQVVSTLGIYRIFDKFDMRDLFFESDDVKNLLHDSEKIAIFACFLGHNIDEQIAKFLEESQVLKAAVWDAIGSEMVEQCTNYINDLVRKKALLEDFLTTKRFSAGYGDWDLQNNIKIAKYLNLDDFGIKVDKYGFLKPQKTITAVLGLKKR